MFICYSGADQDTALGIFPKNREQRDKRYAKSKFKRTYIILANRAYFVIPPTEMSKDGKDDPLNTKGRDTKGKGRSGDEREDAAAEGSGSGSGLLRSVVESARSSVTPQALASAMVSGGKGSSISSTVFNDGSMQRMKDIGGVGGSNSSPRAADRINGSIRSTPIRTGGTDAYNQFSV